MRGPPDSKTMKGNRDTIKLTFTIGDQRITLNVPDSRREFAKDTAAEIDALYRKWKRDFPKKTDREVLAMIAYQYASFLGELKERHEKAIASASGILRTATEALAAEGEKPVKEIPDNGV